MLAATIVMAAGIGTRMKSALPKVLHRVLGRPLVQFPVRLALEGTQGPVVVVGGAFLEELRRAVLADTPSDRLLFACQEHPRGTADAVRAGLAALPPGEGPERRGVLILNGDVPCLSPATLVRLITAFDEGRDVAFLGFHAADPTGYGRVLYDDSGVILGIREEKELRPEDREIDLVNGGIYLVEEGLLRSFVAGMKRSEHHGEFLLTDVVEHAVGQGRGAEVVIADAAGELDGVNTREHLAEVTRILRRRRNRELMLGGVSLPSPDDVDVDFGVEVGPDTLLEPGVALRGATRIAGDVTIGRGSVVEGCVIGRGCRVLPYCVLESTELREGCTVGPFAHTRPGTVLEDGAKIGNFVETKKTRVGAGSKVNHLTYLGDCDVGRQVNVGAGTITCNYDGVHKHRTVLGDRVFVGSDVQLVAPVTVGAGATLAAGATITEDVPAGALAISRTPQVNVGGYAERKQRDRGGA